MTEVERYDPDVINAVPLPEYPLSRWADEFLDTARVSSELDRTRFVPKSLWVMRVREGKEYFDAAATTAQVTAAIVTGRELGLSPMAALRSIDVIEGSPALRAVALRAVLLAHGHDIWVEEATNNRATVAGRRFNSDHEQRITWTMDDARARNLAGKRNWKTQPRNMLIARATGDVARLIAADALLGVPYTVEELEDQADMVTSNGGVVDQAAPTRRARRPKAAIADPPGDEPELDEKPAQNAAEHTGAPARVATAAEPDDEPPLDEPGTGEQPPEDEPPPAITTPQQRLLHKLLRDRGLNRDSALAAINNLLDRPAERPVESTKELSADEASRVIDWLSPDPEPEENA